MTQYLSKELKQHLFEGTVIPAYPLALDSRRKFDEVSQRALTHYYIDAGVGGLAVGVHTTQFEIRDKEHNLFETVLKIASEEIDKANLSRPFLKIAGVCGPTKQALEEAELALKYGYHIALLSMGQLDDYTEEMLLERTKEVAKVMPVFGFYLQPSVGGRVFSYDFWKRFMEIDNVVAVKTAPFNRYQTLDVLRAVCESSRYQEIAVYTGNDDNIVPDLLTVYETNVGGEYRRKEVVGGLLGHWAVWTRKAVELFERIKRAKQTGDGYAALLTEGIKITDANAAFFDIHNDFEGCIPGINYVLAKQGLLPSYTCLNPDEKMGAGQTDEIARIYQDYPHLNDDQFVQTYLNEWYDKAKGDK